MFVTESVVRLVLDLLVTVRAFVLELGFGYHADREEVEEQRLVG